MTIVAIGKLSLQVPESGTPQFVLNLCAQIEKSALFLAERMIEESLATELDRFLERGRYERRRRSKQKETAVHCSKWRSHKIRDFRRNGHYERRLLTQWGVAKINMPQVQCQCGGNVRIQSETGGLRQRIWEDVKMEIQVESGRGLSYRQIKLGLDQRYSSSVGLRTLNAQVLSLGQTNGSFKPWKKGEAPPVVRVDGIWITVMFSTGQTQIDQAGRKRVLKYAKQGPILAAQGVWPATGRTELIGWMRSDGEDCASWQQFLENLYESGLTPENGLILLVADGGKGFRAADENIYWQVPLQRCVFHKLRNLAQAIGLPTKLERQAARQYATEFLQSATKIWRADGEDQARWRYVSFCNTWQATQPKAVQTLARDFEDTLTFYAIQEQAAWRGEQWPAYLLRTTSPLERMLREFRQRDRRAISFHSEIGLQAATAQIASRFS